MLGSDITFHDQDAAAAAAAAAAGAPCGNGGENPMYRVVGVAVVNKDGDTTPWVSFE